MTYGFACCKLVRLLTTDCIIRGCNLLSDMILGQFNQSTSDPVRFQVLPAASMKMAVFKDTARCSLVGLYRSFTVSELVAQMMEAVRTSETSVYFYKTPWRHIPVQFTSS
jgi:hypothetical protein